MKASLLALLLCSTSPALADYVIRDGNGNSQTIEAGEVSGNILPYSAPVDANGVALTAAPGTTTTSALAVQPITSTRAKTTAAASSLTLKNSAGKLYDLSLTIGATTGYLMLFDDTSLPANGAVTPLYCFPVVSNGTFGAAAFAWPQPIPFSDGIVAAFSSTGCTTLTASATANIFGGFR